MFPSSYYSKLDPSYREALLKLENDIKDINKFSYIYEDPAINEFLSNYLMPRELWERLWDSRLFPSEYNRLKLHNPSLYHLSYFDINFMECSNQIVPARKTLDKPLSYWEGGFQIYFVDVADLCYPHNLLQVYLTHYESDAESHLPKKIIDRNMEMRKLYDKIKAVEDNEEDWINAMIEADDIEFVKHNVEYKLGQDLTNKKLWILYIKYLKEYDIPELLNTYSKYCRFFVDDVAMKEEYQKAAKVYGKVTVPWKNAFDFEIYNENMLEVEYPERSESYERGPKKKILLDHHFTSETAMPQKFPFRPHFIDYIVKAAKANELQKLNFCCKFFYSKYRIPVCYHLFVLSAGPTWNLFDYEEESLYIHSDTLKEVELNNFYISTKLYYHHRIPLRSLISKIHRCDAKFIDISLLELTMDELKFFIGHGNVVELRFCRIKIIDANGEDLFLEDILALTPKLEYLVAYEAYCSLNTAQKLCELPFESKLMRFDLRNGTNVLLEPNAFGEFINKNASPHCNIIVNVYSNDGGAGNAFASTVGSVIDKHWGKGQKPSFSTVGY